MNSHINFRSPLTTTIITIITISSTSTITTTTTILIAPDMPVDVAGAGLLGVYSAHAFAGACMVGGAGASTAESRPLTY